VQLDYVLPHRGQRGQSFVYELLFDGGAASDAPQLVGLLDVEALRAASSRGLERSSRGSASEFAGSSRPQSGAFAASSRGEENPPPARPDAVILSLAAALPETAVLRSQKSAAQRKPNSIVVAAKTNGAALPA